MTSPITRPCPRCHAAIGEHCIIAIGRWRYYMDWPVRWHRDRIEEDKRVEAK